ncbi:MAG: cytochrome c [Desulfuromonadales bacterium]
MKTKVRGIGLAGLLGLIAVLCVSGCSDTQVNYPDRQMPAGLMSDQNQLEAGKTLFMNKCAHCHGKPSEGRSDRAAFFEPPAPDFTDKHFQEMDPAYLYWRIDVGKTVEPYRSQGSVMPAWGVHLSETQIWQLVAYIRSRAH